VDAELSDDRLVRAREDGTMGFHADVVDGVRFTGPCMSIGYQDFIRET